ncbi:hypothetical protein GCM10028785_11860 [Hydrogenophaga soli]
MAQVTEAPFPAPATPTAKPRTRRKAEAREVATAFAVGKPVNRFGEPEMPAHEQAVVNAALAILGQRLRTRGPLFECPQSVRNYLALALGDRPHEVFAVLFLDSQHRLLAFEEMFRGTVTQTSVYPREVVIRALHHGASAVVLAHNHPSGSLQPSAADRQLTLTLKNALALVEVKVLDHFVVSAGGSTSLAELGLV